VSGKVCPEREGEGKKGEESTAASNKEGMSNYLYYTHEHDLIRVKR
jgi:hypothetical protein